MDNRTKCKICSVTMWELSQHFLSLSILLAITFCTLFDSNIEKAGQYLVSSSWWQISVYVNYSFCMYASAPVPLQIVAYAMAERSRSPTIDQTFQMVVRMENPADIASRNCDNLKFVIGLGKSRSPAAGPKPLSYRFFWFVNNYYNNNWSLRANHPARDEITFELIHLIKIMQFKANLKV